MCSVIELLKNRGYFIQNNCGRYELLSSYYNPAEIDHLSMLLEQNNVGKLHENKYIEIFDDVNISKFKQKLMNRESGCEGINESKDYSCLKIERAYLDFYIHWVEPYIAKYIKSLWCCGLETYYTCDGFHDKNHLHFGFAIVGLSEYFDIFHKAMWKFKLDGIFKGIKWDEDYTRIKLGKNKEKVYSTLMSCADFIFENRNELISIRIKAYNQTILEEPNSNKDFKEKIFRNCEKFFKQTTFKEISK